MMFLLTAAIIVGTAQEPKKDPPGEGKKGFGGFTRTPPGTVLSSFVIQQLKVTDEQKKELDDLQKQVDEKLAKILTDDQKKQLKDMNERRGGFNRPPGPQGKRPNPDATPKKKDDN